MATYYVDPVSGNDANAGTSLALAFKTTQKAADTAVAGDTVYLCATGVETVAAKVDLDTNAGSELSPIRFRGANASGVVDGTRYVIRAATGATALLDFAAAADYTKWFDVEFDSNAVATNCVNNGVDASDFHLFRRCRFHGATGAGFNVRGTQTKGWQLYNCESDHNGGEGVAHAAVNRGYIWWFGGSIHHNGGAGWIINAGNQVSIQGVRIYRNTGHGIDYASNSQGSVVRGNTIYGNGGSGVRFFSTALSRGTQIVCENTSVGNTRYGFEFQSGSTEVGWFMDYNHTYNNTLGASDLTLPGDYNKTGDPLFASTTDGSEDFTPGAGSPLIGAGLSGGVIGAASPAAGGSGGGVSRSRAFGGAL